MGVLHEAHALSHGLHRGGPQAWARQMEEGLEEAKVAHPHGHSPGFRARSSQVMSALTDVSQGPRRPRRGDFLAALDPSASREVPKSATRGRHLGRSSFDEDAEDVVEKAEEAEAVTSLASAELRKVLQESNEASEDALAAAQVAVITEAVAFVGGGAQKVELPRVITHPPFAAT
eukprot:g21699.t1